MRRYTIHDIDKLGGHEFEFFCAELLKKNGYDNVEVTQGSGDQGIDVIAYKDGIKFGIQCKCYTSDIGNKAVQEAFSGREYYKCHIGAVLSNRFFTRSAIELAKRNRILLWDREYLIDLLKKTDLYYEGNIEEDDLTITRTDEVPSTENVTNITLSGYGRAYETLLIETDVNNDTHSNAGTDSTEREKRYNVILRVDDRQVIKNYGRRKHTANQISGYTGISFASAQAKLLYESPATLLSGISKEEAEKIVHKLTPLGCTVYMEEKKESNQEEYPGAFSKIKDTFSAVFYIILGILPPIMTKACWDWEHSMGKGFGICTALCVILTFLITIPMAILLIYALSHNQQ